MLEHSVLARTGQLWKIQSALCAVLAGGAALVYGIASDTGEGAGLFWIAAGLLLALGGLAFASACPARSAARGGYGWL